MKKLKIKRLVVKWSIICILVLLFALFILSLRGIGYPGLRGRATLYVNGEEIIDHEVKIYQRDIILAWLPFTAILKETGCSVQWMTNETAEITINGQFYVLTESKLFKQGEDKNIIVPGYSQSRIEYVFKDQELYLDSRCVKATMENLGIPIELDIDPESRIITIYTIKGGRK